MVPYNTYEGSSSLNVIGCPIIGPPRLIVVTHAAAAAAVCREDGLDEKKRKS